jgi:uncharacterized DUF497 family protein
MIDWTRITGFDWDDGNGRKSADKHGVSRAEAEQVFFNEPLLVLEDAKHGGAEARLHALGVSDDARQLHISFTLREDGTRLRVISARDMSRNERKIYAEAQANP